MQLTSQKIVGRSRELALLGKLSKSQAAQFLAVYGRRRVGKTYLIREFFRNSETITFYCVGMKDGGISVQLDIFKQELETAFYDGKVIPPLRTWQEAFKTLLACIEDVLARNPNQQIVIFLDELPWLALPRSTKLLQSIDHYWNRYFRELQNLRLIICGSAASWIIKKILKGKGGLHNRLTATMKLDPLTLPETIEYLRWRGFEWSTQQYLELYLAFGGIPYYLDHIDGKLSVAQNISVLCTAGGLLVAELENLFAALFGTISQHREVALLLAQRWYGATRNEIAKTLGISSGGALTAILDDLKYAGFIAFVVPVPGTQKEGRYLLIDEYVSFAHRWLQPRHKMSSAQLLLETQSRSYVTILALAFERTCLKHSESLKRLLGFEVVRATFGPWFGGEAGEKAQIDLVFDRADGVITLVEVKYSTVPFQLTAELIFDLQEKQARFVAGTGTKKSITWALVSSSGIVSGSPHEQFFSKIISGEMLLGP